VADAGITGLDDTRFRFTTADDTDRDGLADATASLRRRTTLPIDRWFQLLGGVLLALGLLAIVVGWYGTSHTTRTWRQTPFVVSGGLLGLGLIFAGGFSYFSYWQTKLLEEARVQSRYLESIDQLLRAQAGAMPTSGLGAVSLVATADDIVHRTDCPVVRGRDDVRPVAGTEPRLQPCPMCDPPLPA
jgi:hypothetical protein